MSEEIYIFSADTFGLRPNLSHSYRPNMRRSIVMTAAFAKTCAWKNFFMLIELNNELKMMQNEKS